MRRAFVELACVVLLLLACAGCGKKSPVVRSGDDYVCEPVRIAMAYTALVEKPDAARALLIGDAAKSLTNYWQHAGVRCLTVPDGRFDIVAVACDEMSKQSCAKACAFLKENGVLVWLMDMRGVDGRMFRERLRSFDLTETHLWMPGADRWVLVGRLAPRRVKLSAMLDLFAREGTFADLARAKCGTLPEFFANYVGRREDVMPAFETGDLTAEVRPEFFISHDVPTVDWIAVDEDVDADIRSGLLNEMRSMQVVRRLVVEGNLASETAKDKAGEEAAIEKWSRAALRNPNDLFLVERLDRLERNARGFLSVGKVLMAMKCFETMLLIQPNNAAAVHNFGMCLMKIGKRDMAEKVLKRAEDLTQKGKQDGNCL